MAKRGLLGLMIGLGAAALTGCGSGAPAVKAKGTVTVPLDAAKKRVSINASVANIVTLVMPPSPPGHVWQIAFHDTRFLKQQTEFVPPRTPEEGYSVSFLALSFGTTRLRFVLVPVSTGGPVNPVDQQDLIIRIQ